MSESSAIKFSEKGVEYYLSTFFDNYNNCCLREMGFIGKKVAVTAAKRQFPLKFFLVVFNFSKASLASASSF